MRFFLTLLFFSLSLFSLDFNPCFQKNSESITQLSDDLYGVYVKDSLLITHSKKPLLINDIYSIIKKDPFFDLYLLKTKIKKNPVIFKNITDVEIGSEVAIIDNKKYEVSKILSKSIGFKNATLAKNSSDNSLIGVKCYKIIGIGVGQNMFIDQRIIENFIDKDPFYYGDLGIRFNYKNSKPYIFLINPFLEMNGLMVGDLIVSINHKPVNEVNEVEDMIMFLDLDTKARIEVNRNGIKKVFNVKVVEKDFFSYQNETFLERFGLYIDKDLYVKDVLKNSISDNLHFEIGDKIISVNSQIVETTSDIQLAIVNGAKKNIKILIQRGGFQFFIFIP